MTTLAGRSVTLGFCSSWDRMVDSYRAREALTPLSLPQLLRSEGMPVVDDVSHQVANKQGVAFVGYLHTRCGCRGQT